MDVTNTTFATLAAKDMKTLLEIAEPADIKQTKMLYEFEDDHIPCCIAKINGVTIALYWCGAKVVGAMDITDSKQAKKIVFDALRSAIHGDVNMMFDTDEDDLKRKMTKAKSKDKYDVILTYLRSLRSTHSLRKEIAGYIKECSFIDDALTVTFPK